MEIANSVPRIAFFDIETAPITGLSWGIFDTNLIHVIEPTFMLCYALKWAGNKRVTTRALCDFPAYEKNRYDDKALVTKLHEEMSGADIVVAHNGDAFDLKKINARFAVHGLGPLPPLKSIDTLKIARRHFKFDSNKLDNIGRYLGVGRKLAHTGKDLWLGCMSGDAKAWKLMRRYNAQDVHLLEAVYDKIKPWDKSHPNIPAYSDRCGCPVCSSINVQLRGFNIAKTRRTQRLQCQDCGHWYSGETIKGVPLQPLHSKTA